MLTIERIKEILDDPTLSDDQATAVRDELRRLAELVFDQWEYERNGDLSAKGLLQDEKDLY
jgi:hypothetical protein